MRSGAVSIVVGLVVVAAVAWSLYEEERFVVESPRLERVGNGTRVAGTLVNRGDGAPLVRIEVSIIADDGRPAEKELVEVHDLAPGARVPFASAVHPGELKSYTIHVNQGRNPYGN